MIIRKKTKNGGAGTESGNGAAAPAATAKELVDMEQAIGLLKTSRPTFYRWLRSGQLKGMKVGRQWRFYREDIERFLEGQGPRIDLRADITPLIDALRQRLAKVGGKDTTPADAGEVDHAVMLMLLLGHGMHASDFHIEPQDGLAVLRYRLDGVLHRVAEFDLRLLPALVERWKTMAACDVQEKSKPQDGSISMSVPGSGEALGLRVCVLPAVQGESLTVRMLSAANIAVEFEIDKLGFSPRDEERLRKAIGRPWGLIIVTAPTGTGKTTTLYSCLRHLAKPENKIITIEDPVECTFPGMTQVQIKPEAGLTLASAMRAALRSAPNVILMGEVRDPELMNICFQATLTGHLVFTTLHTNDAPSAVKRMLDMGMIPHLIADTAVLIVAQRLVRRVCPHCSKEQANPPFLERTMEMARRGGLDWASLTPRFRQGAGCAKCNMTGYRGRVIIAETMEFTPELQTAIRRGASVEELRTIAIGQGMTTFAADGIRKAAAGVTTVEEVIRTVGVGG